MAKFTFSDAKAKIKELEEELKKKGYPIAYVGDVVGTGSSRKSAINLSLIHI